MDLKLLKNTLVSIGLAISLLGCVEQQGLSQQKFSASDIRYIERQAQRGDADAQYSLGVLYAEGHSLEKDEAAAVEWFSSAARQEHPEATYNLAYSYFHGSGVSQNYELALRYAKDAANLGLAMADNLIGVMYESGLGTEQDYDAAFQHYISAAQQSDPHAQLNLATLYLYGNGVERNLSRALHWARQSAMQGHAPAQAELAYLHSGEIDGIPQDLEKTYDWASRAAEQDNGFGHYILGALYKDGLGVPRDLVIAYMRYLLSERAGFERGDGRLQPIADRLSAAQLIEAQALKDQCIERNFQGCEDAELISASNQSDMSDSVGGGTIDTALETSARNQLSCMAAYSRVVSKCSDIAAFKRAAANTNKENAELVESYGMAPETLGQVEVSDFIVTCIGKETEDVFGNSKAAERVVVGVPADYFPNENAAAVRYDWVEAGLEEMVQKMVDRIYAEPDAEAPMALQRPLARALGHAQLGQELLLQAGFSESEVVEIVTQYENTGGDDLIGQYPENQSTAYKIKACLELL